MNNSVNAGIEEINIYSYRQPFLIKPLLNAFTNETKIKVNVIYSQIGIINYLKKSNQKSRVDLVLTTDIAPLYKLAKNGLSQPVYSEILEKNIPAQYRDPNHHWFGLTARARIIYASKNRVKEGEIKNYEDLSKPEWRGRICIRSAKHTYNLSLISSMIIAHGVAKTEKWLREIQFNLARLPYGNDRVQVKAIYEGVCDIAIANSYYFGKMIYNTKNPEQIDWAESVNLIFPNQSNRGTHMAVSGIAMARNAPNKANALILMEYLSGSAAQYKYARENFEFPVKEGVERSPLVEEYMGNFKADKVSIEEIAANRDKAMQLVDKIAFDQYPF